MFVLVLIPEQQTCDLYGSAECDNHDPRRCEGMAACSDKSASAGSQERFGPLHTSKDLFGSEICRLFMGLNDAAGLAVVEGFQMVSECVLCSSKYTHCSILVREDVGCLGGSTGKDHEKCMSGDNLRM